MERTIITFRNLCFYFPGAAQNPLSDRNDLSETEEAEDTTIRRESDNLDVLNPGLVLFDGRIKN